MSRLEQRLAFPEQSRGAWSDRGARHCTTIVTESATSVK